MNPNTHTKRSRGRPPGASQNSMSVVFPMRLHREDAKLIEHAAKKSGKIRTEWMRDILVAVAKAA